ncbi:uncharacterized protein LOC100262326 [Vitis vinifera]|nr:uncharacterized protein LOC100262326 [Vitis vinifera]
MIKYTLNISLSLKYTLGVWTLDLGSHIGLGLRANEASGPVQVTPPLVLCFHPHTCLILCVKMAAKEQEKEAEEFVYRISTAQEWEELQKAGACYGGQLDKSTGCIHLSNLHQVQSTLQNFFMKTQAELYLLQVDSKKLGDGLIYERVDECNVFPHFYGPSRSFIPLPLDAVTKAEKITLSDGKFSCSLLN